MKHWLIKITLILTVALCTFTAGKSWAQQDYDDEIIRYYQMETLDDSLFVKIQEEMRIDPPNPKAEIVVDLRDPQNQTITIQGTVYPFLAFSPEIRARIITYPFRLNLEDDVTYTSVFTRVIKKIKLRNLAMPPKRNQILSTRAYINPYYQIFGGERLGLPIKKDIGMSLGTGTPYSGVLESDQMEVNFHALGAYVGYVSNASFLIGKNTARSLTEKSSMDGSPAINHGNRMHLMYAANSLQVGYVFPLGNFFEVNFQTVQTEILPEDVQTIMEDSAGGFKPKIMTGSYYNWELRYPMRNLGSTRSKFYVASYQKEMHFGYTGRELALVGSNFDLRMDFTLPFGQDKRPPHFVLEFLISKIAEGWAASAMSIGPSLIVGVGENKKIKVNTLFINMSLKLGSSL